MRREFKRGLAGLLSVAMLASVTAFPCDLKVNAAYQKLGETSFDYKMLPWHTVETSPARQNFELTGAGELHISVLIPSGSDGEKWDLQLRHRGLDFTAGHTYEVEFKARSSRAGLMLCSQIQSLSAEDYYFVLDEDEMHNGPSMGGQWGKAASLTTEWQTFRGTFTPTEDIGGSEWVFQYASGTQYEGNAEMGDEIWFDDMSVMDITDEIGPDYSFNYGYVNRMNSGLKNNFISVNQLGYLSDSKKVAVLGDNKGDILHYAETITLDGAVDFEVVDSETGAVVYKGKSSKPEKDIESGDKICRLDFSEVTAKGRYYIRAGEYNSAEFAVYDGIYGKEDHDLLTDAMNYFYQNRSGVNIEAKYITSGEASKLAHNGTHKTDAANVQKIWKHEYQKNDDATETYYSSLIDARGGWYEAADQSKNTVSGGMALWTLQNMYERASKNSAGLKMFEDNSGKIVIPENGNKVPDVLDEAAYELDWMAKLKVSETEKTWGESAKGLYYHAVKNHKWTGLNTLPYIYSESWEETRIATPPTFAATLAYAACAAQAARLWEPYDSAKAKQYFESAVEAYRAYQNAFYDADNKSGYNGDFTAEEKNDTSLYAPRWNYIDQKIYGDLDVKDDAYRAACEIFISAKRMGADEADDFLKELESYDEAYTVQTMISGGANLGGPNNYGEGSDTSFNWGNTASAGTLSLALNSDLISAENMEKIKTSLFKAADRYLKTEESSYGAPYRIETVYNNPSSLDPGMELYGYEYNSNGCILNNAIVMAYAYDIDGSQKYKDGVTTAMDYLLGTNPLSFSFISGYGEYALKNPHHFYWTGSFEKSKPDAPDGVISSGSNVWLDDNFMKALGFVPGKYNPSQRCYADSWEAWSVNSSSLEANASLAWVAAFIQNPETEIVSKPAETPSPKVTEPEASPKVTEPEASPKVTEPAASPKVTEPAASPKATEPVNVDPGPNGDLNLDGIVDLTDLTMLAISLVDKEPLGVIACNNADVNADGNVDIVDLATIRMFLSKKIKTL